MRNNPPSGRQTLGQYLEAARQTASLSLRQLADLAELSKSTVDRILRDEVENPSIEQLRRLATVLEVDIAEVLAFTIPASPQDLPTVAPYLRAKYKLQGQALSKAAEQIQRIIDKYDNTLPDK